MKKLVLTMLAVFSVAAEGRAQKPDSFRKHESHSHRASDKRPQRVGDRMADDMVGAMRRFKGAPHDSALRLLFRQSKHHLIVQSQCDFELRMSRQNASPTWQALSDSVARDTRRVVSRYERLSPAEINDVLGRAARMAEFCRSANRSAW